MHAIIRLPCPQRGHKSMFPCIRHDIKILSDASYLSEAKARSRACGHFFMGWMPKNGDPIQLNGVFHISTTVMQFVVAPAAEAELVALYHDCQTGIIFDSHWRKWDTRNPKYQYIATMPLWWELQIIQ